MRATGYVGVRGPEVVAGHEEIQIELDAQTQQFASAVVVDTGEGLVECAVPGDGETVFLSPVRPDQPQAGDKGALPSVRVVDY